MGKIARSETYSSIIAKLPDLPRGELEQLRSRISAQLHLTAGEPDLSALPANQAERDDPMFVLECISEVLSGLGVEFVSAGILRKAAGFGAFKEKVPLLMHFLRRASKERRCQRAILCVGVDVLYQNMTQMGLPISGRAVMNNLHRVPSTLLQAFPAGPDHLAMILIQDDERRKGNVRTERSNGPNGGRRKRASDR
jgi:hypothetical protein